MKQKMLVKVSMNCEKSRTKALKIAVGFSGVESVSFKGDDKSQIEVTGKLDPVQLTSKLRKNVGHAELVSVEEKKDEKEKDKDDGKQVVWPTPSVVMYEVPPYDGYAHQQCDPCSIM